MKKEQNLQKPQRQALNIPVVRRSACCDAETYEAPAYYTNTMKTHKGEEIPKKIVCLKCGHECSERLF